MTPIQWVSWLHNLLRIGDVSLYDYLGAVTNLLVAWAGLVRICRWHRDRYARQHFYRRHRR